MTVTRKDARTTLAGLLSTALTGVISNKPKAAPEDPDVPAVYRGQVANFQKARSAVVVSSSGSTPEIIASASHILINTLTVDTFVLYADPDANWDEEQAEDLLDEISAAIADVISNNQQTTDWSQIDWIESRTDPVSVGGTEYRHERITLKLS
jgi:hypothetical protein